MSMPNFTAIGTIVFEIRLLQTHVRPPAKFVRGAPVLQLAIGGKEVPPRMQ